MKKSAAAALLALSPFLGSGSAPAAEPSASAAAQEQTVQAYWNTYEIDFSYMGLTTYYSCDGLRDSVRDVLRMVGAREDLKIRARGCEISGTPAVFPRVLITVSVPVEATPENLAELAKDADKRELVAWVRGERAIGVEGPDLFAAVPRQVTISDRGTRDLDPGECELVEQLRDRVFPKLGIRVVDDQLRCIPKHVRHGQIKLTVQALFEAPKPDEIGQGEAQPQSAQTEGG
jgi:hypothetical protein